MSQLDEQTHPYGDSPWRRIIDAIYAAPAWSAVAIELGFVIVFCNQWVIDHVVVSGTDHGGQTRQDFDSLLSSFSWTATPRDGYTALWLAGLARIVVWLGLSFVLVRVSCRARSSAAMFVATLGSVLLSAIPAVMLGGLISYHDVHAVQVAIYGQPFSGPGVVDSTLFRTLTNGTVLAVLLVGLMVAGAVRWFAQDTAAGGEAAGPPDPA